MTSPLTNRWSPRSVSSLYSARESSPTSARREHRLDPGAVAGLQSRRSRACPCCAGTRCGRRCRRSRPMPSQGSPRGGPHWARERRGLWSSPEPQRGMRRRRVSSPRRSAAPASPRRTALLLEDFLFALNFVSGGIRRSLLAHLGGFLRCVGVGIHSRRGPLSKQNSGRRLRAGARHRCRTGGPGIGRRIGPGHGPGPGPGPDIVRSLV